MLTATPTTTDSDASPASLSPGRKMLLLLCNAIPLLHVAALGTLVWMLRFRPGICVSAVLICLYLFPPLACRLALLIRPVRRAVIPVGSGDFYVWWLALNLQMLFCRLPALEEILRLVPGFYSLWLRLWGAKIGKLTYWAAGLRILDRSFLDIGDNVTFGAGVRLNPHVLLPGPDGRTILALAPVTIGDGASVGGYSLLIAGSQIAPGECTRACLILPPFNRLQEGRRRVREDSPLACTTTDPAVSP